MCESEIETRKLRFILREYGDEVEGIQSGGVKARDKHQMCVRGERGWEGEGNRGGRLGLVTWLLWKWMP